jgi:hypothetical protein
MLKEITKKLECLRAFHLWLLTYIDVNALKSKKKKADFVTLMSKMVRQMEDFERLIGVKEG